MGSATWAHWCQKTPCQKGREPQGFEETEGQTNRFYWPRPEGKAHTRAKEKSTDAMGLSQAKTES